MTGDLKYAFRMLLKSPAFSGVVIVTVGAGTDNTARNVTAARVSANFFSVLGLPPALGRTFTADEDREGGPAVVIISDDFWRQNLGASSNVIGANLTINERTYTIVG